MLGKAEMWKLRCVVVEGEFFNWTIYEVILDGCWIFSLAFCKWAYRIDPVYPVGFECK